MNEPITTADDSNGMVYHQGPCRTVLPTEADVADALIQHETSGMCHYGRTCGTCDCGRISLTVEGVAEQDAMELGRARAVLALFAGQPTEQAVRADEALLIVGQRDRGRGFDQLLREQLQDPEVRAGYVAGRLRRTDLHLSRAFKSRLTNRAARIESEG